MGYMEKMMRDTVAHFKGNFGNWAPILRKGHPGVLADFTPQEKEELRKLTNGQKQKRGYCYMNAQLIALRGLTDRRVKYIEGFVSAFGIPVSHAWIEFNGKVFDPTLRSMRTWEDKMKMEREYYGMEVPKNMIMKNQLQTKKYCPLTEWPSKFAPILLKEENNVHVHTRAGEGTDSGHGSVAELPDTSGEKLQAQG